MALRVKLDLDTLAYDQHFERICGVRCKGSQQGVDNWIFIVPMGKAGKAIGKGAENIRKLHQSLSNKDPSFQNKRVRIVEFHPNIKIFIKNLISPLQVAQINVEGNTVQISDPSKKTKSLLIGPGGNKQKQLNNIIERFFQKTVKIR